MASAIFGAIGRGYSARTILSAIGRRTPQYANAINTAYYTGYTAEHILSKIASSKDGRQYDPEMFLTDFEKTQKRDNDQKKDRLLATLAASGTLAAVGVGIHALIQRNKAIRPDEIIIPTKGAKGAKGKPGTTIHQQNKQLPNLQKQLPYNPKLIEQKKPLITPYNPPPPQSRNQPQEGTQASQQPIQPMQMSKGQPSQQAPKYLQSVNLVKNLREESRFNNLVGAGYDEPTTELMLRSTLPKDAIALFDKAPGGLEQLVKDYSLYLKENPQISALQKNIEKEKQQQQQIQPVQAQTEAPQELPKPQQVPSLDPSAQQPPVLQQQAEQPRQAPISTPEIVKPQEPTKPLASLKNGKLGEIESVKNGVATINVDGNIVKAKSSEITNEPPGIETAVREVINSIPENLKSTALQSMVYIPETKLMLAQFYDGKWAWYLDFDEETYNNISLGTYQPKGQGKTSIAEYQPNVADSRGAGFHNEVKINPKYSKENKGKTWGYADNKYSLLHSIQPIIHKISKERIDEHGKIVTPKTRKKRQS